MQVGTWPYARGALFEAFIRGEGLYSMDLYGSGASIKRELVFEGVSLWVQSSSEWSQLSLFNWGLYLTWYFIWGGLCLRWLYSNWSWALIHWAFIPVASIRVYMVPDSHGSVYISNIVALQQNAQVSALLMQCRNAIHWWIVVMQCNNALL